MTDVDREIARIVSPSDGIFKCEMKTAGKKKGTKRSFETQTKIENANANTDPVRAEIFFFGFRVFHFLIGDRDVDRPQHGHDYMSHSSHGVKCKRAPAFFVGSSILVMWGIYQKCRIHYLEEHFASLDGNQSECKCIRFFSGPQRCLSACQTSTCVREEWYLEAACWPSLALRQRSTVMALGYVCQLWTFNTIHLQWKCISLSIDLVLVGDISKLSFRVYSLECENSSCNVKAIFLFKWTR